MAQYRVTKRIDGAHKLHDFYPLLPHDRLIKCSDGTFTKIAPGLCLVGFELTEEQQATLEELDD